MRLIDADKLKTHYSWWTDETKELFDIIINLQPTIEAEPVVRCKDCVHYGTSIAGLECQGYCQLTEFMSRKDNDFCSYGERKEVAE